LKYWYTINDNEKMQASSLEYTENPKHSSRHITTADVSIATTGLTNTTVVTEDIVSIMW
jgi:hypothetical protein